ncbi:MAG: alpha/beta hydrolase [Maricaulaceae bacterium]
MIKPRGYERRFHDLRDGQISAIHCGDLSRPIELVFLHGNGFNGLTYRHILEKLPVHSVSLDLRGHGFSTLPIPSEPLTSFDIFKEDVLDFIRRHTDGQIMIVGHSLGGAVALMVNQAQPDKIKSALILDPPTLPSSWRFLFRIPAVNRWLMKNFSFAKKARARTSIFPDEETLFKHYKTKRAFKAFTSEILRDYIEGGTRPHKDGIELCCDPKWEARVFLGHDNDIFGAAKKLPKNSFYIMASERMASSPLTRLKIRFIMGKHRMKIGEGFAHLFPMEDPDYVAAQLKRLLAN